MNNISQVLYQKFGVEKPVLPNKTYSIIGISKQTFRKYLNNEKQPTLDELERLAKWMGVPLKELINF